MSDDEAWMDMMDGFPLFDDDEDDGPSFQSGSGGGASNRRRPAVPRPPESRRANRGLVGLANLGATCYMNSLIQAMFFTPGFRDALFRLTYADLRVPDDGNLLAPTARRIPIELQRLLAEMTALDRASVTTKRLVDAFGWSDSDMREQHDVQELNRLLFDAIDRSLVGTPGAGFVPSLYNGQYEWTTRCRGCCANPSVSVRVEPFQDVQLSVVDVDHLKQVLEASFVQPEKFTDDNRIRCGNCSGLADGERTCRLSSPLPAVLTFSLNRYQWDMATGERRKVNSRFAFPANLDVRPFCTDDAARALDSDGGEYLLYAVVLHSGGAGGGHYTALVKDFRDEGSWERPEPEGGGGSGGGAQASGAATGAGDGEWVTVGNKITKGCVAGAGGDDDGGANAEPGLPPAEERWFCVNDQHITCATHADIEKAFAGSTSAYMLFYVRRSHADATLREPLRLPDAVRDVVDTDNASLAAERADYEDKVNTIDIFPVFSSACTTDGVVLCPRDGVECGSICEPATKSKDGDSGGAAAAATVPISVDRRKPVSVLLAQLAKQFSAELDSIGVGTADVQINRLGHVPCASSLWFVGAPLWPPRPQGAVDGDGGAACEESPVGAGAAADHDALALTDCGFGDGAQVLVWNGADVGGDRVAVAAADAERPVVVHVTLHGVSADDRFDERCCDVVLAPTLSTVGDLVAAALPRLGVGPPAVAAERMVVWKSHKKPSEVGLDEPLAALTGGSGSSECEAALFPNHGAADGRMAELLSASADAVISATVAVPGGGSDLDVKYDAARQGDTVGALKAAIVRRLDPRPAASSVRLRAFATSGRVFASSRLLPDEWTLDAALLRPGAEAYLAVENEPPVEPGGRPVKVQLGRSVVVDGKPDYTLHEVVTPPGCTIRYLAVLAAAAVGVDPGGQWHLCTTTWNSDRGCVIDDLGATLEQANVPANDMLLLEAGDVIPRGFVDVEVHWHRPHLWGCETAEDVAQELAESLVRAWLAAAAQLARLPGITAALELPVAATLGVSSLTDCVDSVDVIVDRRIVPVGRLRVRQQLPPRELLLDHIAAMPELQGHPALDGVDFAHAVRVREVREGRLGRVLVPASPPQVSGGKVQLHTTQHLCLEVGAVDDAPPPGYKAGMPPPLLVHVARRNRATRSYHRSQQLAFWPPHTTDSLAEQLTALVGIPANEMRACRFVRKRRTWDQLVPAVAIPASASTKSSPKRKKGAKGKVGKGMGGGKGSPKKLQVRTNLKGSVKHGDVIGVDHFEPGSSADMRCGADRAEELSSEWLAEQRRVARLVGAAARDQQWQMWVSASSGSGASRRVEPVLRIVVPDFQGMDSCDEADDSADDTDTDDGSDGSNQDAA